MSIKAYIHHADTGKLLRDEVKFAMIPQAGQRLRLHEEDDHYVISEVQWSIEGDEARLVVAVTPE